MPVPTSATLPSEEYERTILGVLLDDAPLSELELTRALHDCADDVHSAITSLVGAGLVYAETELLFPTRAARRFAELAGV